MPNREFFSDCRELTEADIRPLQQYAADQELGAQKRRSRPEGNRRKC